MDGDPTRRRPGMGDSHPPNHSPCCPKIQTHQKFPRSACDSLLVFSLEKKFLWAETKGLGFHGHAWFHVPGNRISSRFHWEAEMGNARLFLSFARKQGDMVACWGARARLRWNFSSHFALLPRKKSTHSWSGVP